MYSRIQVNVQEKVRVHKLVYDHISKLLTKVAKYDPCYDFQVQFKGSTYEGLKIGNPDEFDFGLVRDNWVEKFDVLVNANTPAGFGYAVQRVKTCLDNFTIAGTNYIDASDVRGHLRKLVEEAMTELGMKGTWISKRPWEGGPVVTFEILQFSKFPSISID